MKKIIIPVLCGIIIFISVITAYSIGHKRGRWVGASQGVFAFAYEYEPILNDKFAIVFKLFCDSDCTDYEIEGVRVYYNKIDAKDISDFDMQWYPEVYLF